MGVPGQKCGRDRVIRRQRRPGAFPEWLPSLAWLPKPMLGAPLHPHLILLVCNPGLGSDFEPQQVTSLHHHISVASVFSSQKKKKDDGKWLTCRAVFTHSPWDTGKGLDWGPLVSALCSAP